MKPLLRRMRREIESLADVAGPIPECSITKLLRMMENPISDLAKAITARYIGLFIIGENQLDDCLGYDPRKKELHMLDPDVEHDYSADQGTFQVFRRIGNGKVPEVRRLQPFGQNFVIKSEICPADGCNADKLLAEHETARMLMANADYLLRKSRRSRY